MIDHTSGRIGQQLKALRRENLRRYAFQRMLQATDRVLWRLEEMNRDGVKHLPRPFRGTGAASSVALPGLEGLRPRRGRIRLRSELTPSGVQAPAATVRKRSVA